MDKEILEQVKKAKKLDNLLIIDAHAHLGKWTGFHIPYNASIEEIIEEMDNIGVARLCISSTAAIAGFCQYGNNQVAEAVKKYPDRLIGYAVVDPHRPREMRDELKRCYEELGLKMIKVHPAAHCHAYPIDGKNYEAVWEYAIKNDTIVLAHVYGNTTWGGNQSEVRLADKVAERYPELKLIYGHAGGFYPEYERAILSAQRFKNIYLEFSGGGTCRYGMIEKFVNEVDENKLLFGSDVPTISLATGIGKITYAKIPTETKRKILGKNMAQLLTGKIL